MSQKQPNKKKDKLNKPLIICVVIILAITLILSAIIISKLEKDKEDKMELPYTELIKEITSGNIEKVGVFYAV